jgi:hypothetical protein|nr:MAG TPA: PilA, PilC, PilN, PilO, PilM, pilus, ring, membrane channel [Caudoviricetes sp.]
MGVDIILAAIGGFVTVFMFFYKLVIFPLSEAIAELKKMIVELREEIKAEREKRGEMDRRVTILEEKTKHIEEVIK